MTVGVLALSLAAWGADLPAKAQAFVDAGELETARKKCIAWGGNVAGADPKLREACAQVWLADARTSNSVEGWFEFRAAWSDTSFADEALAHEAELALAALSKPTTEKALLALFAKYSSAEAGKQAYRMAAEAAIASIQTDADARSVSERYPEQAEALLKSRLSAFVTATVTATTVTDIRSLSPLVDAKTIVAQWSATKPDGTMVAWSDHVAASLTAYGIPADAIARWPADSPQGPSFPRCRPPPRARRPG